MLDDVAQCCDLAQPGCEHCGVTETTAKAVVFTCSASASLNTASTRRPPLKTPLGRRHISLSYPGKLDEQNDTLASFA